MYFISNSIEILIKNIAFHLALTFFLLKKGGKNIERISCFLSIVPFSVVLIKNPFYGY